ncbi:MAG: hypothetical protein P8J33_05530 [Pirellulaceae bacterium]|nr:hypothetical protein [Pirellulaceae bacterium]
MTYIKTIEVAAAEGALKKIYDAASKRAGGVAKIIQIMSLTPEVCQASMGFYLAAVMSENTLDRGTREMLATVVSNVNDCYY